MKTIKLGSMYRDGQVQNLLFSCRESANISLDNTISGREIEWVQVRGILAATQCVCMDISWEQLNLRGYIFGRLVQIDGKRYLCRSFKVGAKNDKSAEWDGILDEYGESNYLWNWEQMYFWGQETPIWNGCESARVIRGFSSPRRWCSITASHPYSYVGFRPVLEPLFSGDPQLLVGSNIKLFGPYGESLIGRLAECDDYDLILDTVLESPAICGWASQIDGQIIVQKGNIMGIREVKTIGKG